VTERFTELFYGGNARFYANFETLKSDPLPGAPKSTKVEFVVNGETIHKTWRAYDKIEPAVVLEELGLEPAILDPAKSDEVAP
jgi:hypothetical protein